jgi:hypothetical protein
MDGLYLLHLMLFSLLGASLSSWLIYEFDNHGRSYVTAYERFFARSKCDHCNAEIKHHVAKRSYQKNTYHLNRLELCFLR